MKPLHEVHPSKGHYQVRLIETKAVIGTFDSYEKAVMAARLATSSSNTFEKMERNTKLKEYFNRKGIGY